MEPLMSKIWALCPKHELDPHNGYDPGRGITGKPPRLVFTSGPGRGSVINFATYKQGAARIAGATIHRLIADEPMPERFFGEIVPRVFHHRGRIRLGFTPTPDMPDVSYLRKKVASKEIEEHNYGLSVENCWPGFGTARRAPFAWTTAQDIINFEASLLPIEREMRMGRSWVPLVTGRLLNSFSPDNVRAFKIKDLADAFLTVGVDHGAAAGKHAVCLVAMLDRFTSRPRAYIIDEVVVEGITTPEMDARSILEMLGKHGMNYDNVDQWVGDRATGSQRYQISKSNRDLRIELAAQIRRPVKDMMVFLEPKKWKSSMTYGFRVLDNMLSRRTEQDEPHLVVHPRCETFAKACREFDGDPAHPLKDVLDAGRYAIERGITKRAQMALRVLY